MAGWETTLSRASLVAGRETKFTELFVHMLIHSAKLGA